jgi:phosphoribosylformimino-5-aminoimidazole carboxamide ribotide isomerase
MLLIPSIDLRGGHCVRLFKGAFDAETRYDLDPALLLGKYADMGASWLHVVDLDGARDGKLGNRDLIAQLAALKRLKIQVGGGLRSLPVMEDLFSAGVARAVIGSAAVEQPEIADEALRRFGPEAVCLAIDVKLDAGGVPRARTRGWVNESPLSLWELIERFSAQGLKHVLCTDIDRDGALAGPNLALYEEGRRRCPGIAWQASGGVRDAADLAALDRLGVAAAISGKALLEGRMTAEELQPFLRDA